MNERLECVQDETEAAVAEHEGGDEAELAGIVPAAFSVHDRDSAEWLVRKVVEAEAHMARVKEQAQREIARTQRERDFLLRRYGPDLERWTREQLEHHKGRRKSVLLLSGTVGLRTLHPRLVVDDAPAVLAWARRHCRKAVVVVEKLSKTVLNEHVQATGELPKGTHLQPVQDRFYIK
jgi:phage host-nuclease inhibitor protein Gam